MAYIAPSQDQLTDEEKKQQESSGSINNAPVLAQQTGDIGGGQPSGAATPTKPEGTSSGSYVNLQKYLNANADQSPSATIAARIGQQGSAARQSLNQSVDTFNQQVKSGAADPNRALVDQAFADPTNFAKDPGNVAAFQKQRTNSYSGPDSLDAVTGYDPSAGYAVADEVRQADSEPGQFALIQRLVGRPSYSRGEQNLDQMLLQNSPQSKQDLDTLRTNYGGIDQEYQNAEGASRQQAQARKDAVAANTQYVADHGASAENDIRSALNSRLNDFNTQKVNLAAQLKAAIQARNGRPLGIAAGTATYGVNPYDYLRSSQDPTIATIATPEEQAKYAALSQLMGQANSDLPYANQAGTYDPSRAAYFDTNAFGSAIADRQKLYNDELNNTYVNQANQTFTYPTQDSVKLTDALAQAKADADAAQYQLGHGGPSGTWQPAIDRYSELQKQLAALQNKWGANDTFKDLIRNPVLPSSPIIVRK